MGWGKAHPLIKTCHFTSLDYSLRISLTYRWVIQIKCFILNVYFIEYKMSFLEEKSFSFKRKLLDYWLCWEMKKEAPKIHSSAQAVLGYTKHHIEAYISSQSPAYFIFTVTNIWIFGYVQKPAWIISLCLTVVNPVCASPLWTPSGSFLAAVKIGKIGIPRLTGCEILADSPSVGF